MLFRCPQSQTNNALSTPPCPLLHFSSHQLRSSPFLLCCGSSDRGIPSLLMLPMGWRAQMKTMYPNGSAKLPQFPANIGGVHVEVRLHQFHPKTRCLHLRRSAVQVAPERSPLPPKSLSYPPSHPQSPSSSSDCGSQTPCCSSAWKMAWVRGEWGAAEKGVFKRTLGCPWNIHMLSDSCLSPFLLSMARERSASYKRRYPHPPCCTHPQAHFHPQSFTLPIQCAPVSPAPQRQQRCLITVKHPRLLCNSFPAIGARCTHG